MDRAEAYINYNWVEVYPEYWIMSNTTELSSYLYNIPLNKIELRCCECGEEVSICSLGDGMKKKAYFAHKQNKEKDDINSECNLRTSNEGYREIFKFEKPRANTFESILHSEMKKFAVSKFWSKENKYVVLREEDIFTYNRDEKTKLRADLLAAPLHSGNGKLIQRSEQYIFEGQTLKNILSVNHIEKAIEYRKLGFLEENIINAYTIEHLNKATYLSSSYIDILNLKKLNNSEINREIDSNKTKRGSIANMLEKTTVDKLSGYYAFHGDTEFLFALKEYSGNHLLFMHIPITEGKNELEERNKHKRRLILASVLDTLTIKDDYCIIAYLYFKDITFINDINEYKQALSMYKNETIEFSQRSLKEVARKYTLIIEDKDREVSNLIDHNKDLEKKAYSLQLELQKIVSEKEAEIRTLKSDNGSLSAALSKKEEEFASVIQQRLKKDLSEEYENLEHLKGKYSSSYEEIAASAEKSVKERLEKEYIHKYAALTDGHTYMRKRVECHRNLLKYLSTVKNETEIEINSSVRCPHVSNVTRDAYIEEFLRMQVFKCADCKRYK